MFRFGALLILALSLTTTVVWAKNSAQKQSVDEELRLKAGDEEGNEIKSLKAELLISKSDDKALNQLKKLVVRYKGTALEPSIYFRLAELYGRKAKAANFFEIHRDKENVVHFSPVVTQSVSSKGWITKEVQTYDYIERNFTHFRDMDLVLFNNAFARQSIGQEKEAMSRYKRVVEDYSESPLVPDCHLAIGESLFHAKSFQAAYDEFQKIRQFSDSRVFPYGLYKGAWSLYNLRRAPEGLKQLEEVVAYSRNPDGGNNRLDLTREALDDMVLFFEDVKTASEAVSYFRRQAGDTRVGDLLLKLGKLYQRHGRYNFLETVYNDLISALPEATERVAMHKDMLDSFDTAGTQIKAVAQLETMSQLCKDGSSWWKAQAPDARKSCWDMVEESGKIYSSKWHNKLKKNQSPEMAQVSRRAYEALLGNGGTVSDEDKYRFNYAELLFQMQDYRHASVQYSKVAHITKNPKFRHDGAYGALVSLEKAVGDKWSDQDEREFARIAQDYVTLNPKGAYITDVKFKKAFIAYDKGRLDESAPQLKDLALQFSSTDRGKRAAHLYLDILNLQKKYELLSDESKSFAQKLKVDAATRAEFIKIHQQAAFTVVQNWEASGKYAQAVQGYLDFVKESPDSSFADKALYNAVRCANLAGNLADAARISERLIAQYPNSQYKKELGHALVVLYEAQAQLGLVAKTLIKLSEWESENKWKYFLSAADYRALNLDWIGAHGLYSEISQKAGAAPEARTALDRLAALAEKYSQTEKSHKLLKLISESEKQPEASLAVSKLAKFAFDSRNEDEAFRLAKKTIAMRNDKKVSVRALAQARLIQAKILEHEFDQAGVKAKPERLTMVLSIKTEKLERAQKAYQDAMAFGDPETAIEALVRLAKCYGKYAAALKTIEAPAEGTEVEKKKFLTEIENLALPIEEKNAETLSIALKQAKNLHLHDGSVASIQDELNRLSRRASRNVIVEFSTPENIFPLVN